MNIIAEISRSAARLPGDETRPQRAFAGITPIIYADLRRLARCFMRGERGGHTLQPTAVVNEAFLRLSRSGVQLNDAPHLFRAAARTMRRVLVDHARERRRIKRNAAPADKEAAAATGEYVPFESPAPLDVLDIDAALDELAVKAPRAAMLLELRYFGGLEDIEISELYGISRSTVERECRFAKAFLIAYGKPQRTLAERMTVGTVG